MKRLKMKEYLQEKVNELKAREKTVDEVIAIIDNHKFDVYSPSENMMFKFFKACSPKEQMIIWNEWVDQIILDLKLLKGGTGMNYAYQEGLDEGYRKGYEDGMNALQERMALNMLENTEDVVLALKKGEKPE